METFVAVSFTFLMPRSYVGAFVDSFGFIYPNINRVYVEKLSSPDWIAFEINTNRFSYNTHFESVMTDLLTRIGTCHGVLPVGSTMTVRVGNSMTWDYEDSATVPLSHLRPAHVLSGIRSAVAQTAHI